MFTVNNKDTRTCFTLFSSVSIVEFEQVNVSWVEKNGLRSNKVSFRDRLSHVSPDQWKQINSKKLT